MTNHTPIRRAIGIAMLLATAVFLLPRCAGESSSEGTDQAKEGQQATAEAPVHKETDPIARGKELYISYCAICHGKDGEAGPMSEEMKVTPPDMATIAARNGGEFPEERIFDIIKGNKDITGHNADNMPIWGETFEESEGLESEEEVNQEIRHIVSYLETIQEG